MVEVNAAWHVLRDPARRRAYDRAIGAPPSHPPPPGDEPETDGVAYLDDEPGPPAPSRPADLLVVVPVLMLVVAVAMFAFSTMSQSTGLRTASLLMAPVIAAAFVAAPLFTMLRARSRGRPGPRPRS
jgi:curved DNA-binding protein CbpA